MELEYIEKVILLLQHLEDRINDIIISITGKVELYSLLTHPIYSDCGCLSMINRLRWTRANFQTGQMIWFLKENCKESIISCQYRSTQAL